MGIGAQAEAFSCVLPFALRADYFVRESLTGSCYPSDEWIMSNDVLIKSPAEFEMLRSLDDVPGKLRKAMRLLAISRKTLCSLLDISRPVLYSWLDSSLEPGELELKKINALSSLIEESGISEPLFRGYVETPIGGFSSSIVDCLTRKEFLDKASALPEMLRAAEALTLERKRRIEMRREHIAELSEAEKDLILEDNLNCL